MHGQDSPASNMSQPFSDEDRGVTLTGPTRREVLAPMGIVLISPLVQPKS